MLYSVLIYGAEGELRTLSKAQDDALVANHIRLHEKFTKERKLGPVVRLMPTTAATTLRLGNESVLMDGPFAETKDLIAGWMVIDVDNYKRALELAGELSAAPGANGDPIHEWLEVRPFMSAPPTVTE